VKIQVNSDKTIAVRAGLIGFVKAEANRILDRFAARITRVEVHLSDVDNRKTGRADKRCLIEVRPMGARPLSTVAKTTDVAAAVDQALRKMERSLTTFFGRMGKPVSMAIASTPKNTPARKKGPAAKKKVSVPKPAAKKTTTQKAIELSPRGPKKKRIYQARRKAWPAR